VLARGDDPPEPPAGAPKRVRAAQVRRGLGLTIAACVLVLGLTGCGNNSFTRLGFPNPITEQGKTVLTLWQGSWIA
jgi:cytochrome c oxidase subunit II